MRDLLFIGAAVGFFAVAMLFAAGCERLVGRSTRDDEERHR
jgi:hypothetical protein